ncbi:membrane protein [Bartonella koehlerae]|uniref:Uncharacterized protein n=1 Tax=Bartonella koehlerae C-29 TaxID=1134510 RepID=A0A067W3S5_9HYPH|nr:membrane protein [Bartonella koehlerae]KEC54495.1 hypothetical protein O9A_01109 [Bartonella koehlerae C-29]
MINRSYQTYGERIAAEKTEREQRNSIWKGIFAILLTVFILWFIFGFLGSFFTKSPQRISHYNTTESSRIVTSPRKDLNPTSPVPYNYKNTRSPSFYEQSSSEERIQPNMNQGVK